MENNVTVNINIDTIAALDIQIAALQDQRKKLAASVKEYMAESGKNDIITSTGHKAMLRTFEKSALSLKLLVAEFGEQFVSRFKVSSEETRFTVK